MNKFIIALIVVFMSLSAYAQSRKSLKDIDRELKQTKSTATAMALIESIGETVPQTDEDVATLGQLMDRFPTQGQKALAKIKDPKFTKAIMKECDREVSKFKADKDKDWKNLPEVQRQEKFNALLNTHAMIATLGNLKNREALPFLKQYITPEYDGTLSYAASQAIGRIAPNDSVLLDEMTAEVGKTKDIDLSVFGDKAFVKIIKELDEPGIKPERKFGLINQIKGSRSPERKKALKELALKHKDEDVRNRSGQALINTMLVNPEDGDSDFLFEWLPKAVTDLNAVWSLTAIRIRFPDKNKPLQKRFVPGLIEILIKGRYESARSKAAELLGSCQIKESLPYLEECILKDKESTVRGSCRYSYYQITGKVLPIFVSDDMAAFEDYYKDPVTIKMFSRIRQDDPNTKFDFDLKRAFEEYKQNKK